MIRKPSWIECSYWLQDREEPGLLEEVKAQICDNITMYAQKYDEEFSSHLPGFVTTVWNLLINTGSHVKYDQVSYTAIIFVVLTTFLQTLLS